MPRRPLVALPQPIFDEPVFAEGTPTPDPARFTVPHPSDAQQYQQIQQLLYDDAVGFPAARGDPGARYALADAWGPHGAEVVQAITAAGQLVFHAAGDTGASQASKYPGELSVADRLANDCHTAAPPDRPSFLYLLGDLIYDFGEAQYYYGQFYEPYRNYPAPIFAIPGNHDSFVLPNTPVGSAPLDTFQRNFCAAQPAVTPEAGSLHRTAMCQPGVYFALDAPFARIIGLFSNALEDPGVISSQGGQWSQVPDLQLAFLTAQLRAIKQTAYAGAVILAIHHPPFSYAAAATAGSPTGTHGGSPAMLADIDRVCSAVGVYPHAVLAGHAHNYQRYTRAFTFAGAPVTVPFLVCGGGGHNVDPLVQARSGTTPAEPADGADVSYLDRSPGVGPTHLTLERHDDTHYGYLRLTADPGLLAIDYFEASGSASGTPSDSLSIDLRTHQLRGPTAAARRPSGPPHRRDPTPSGTRGRRFPRRGRP